MRSALLVLLLGLSSVACTKVKVEEAAGPDTGHWRRISCNHVNEKCYQAAAAMCPNGYYFGRIGGGAPKDALAAPAAKNGVTKLPPQEKWTKDMYSREPGALLVKCADATASN